MGCVGEYRIMGLKKMVDSLRSEFNLSRVVVEVVTKE
jgi:hypothetical protein